MPGRRLTTEEFIEKALVIHGDKYDYSLVVYVNYETKIQIVCEEHGEFWQKPEVHLKGSGCLVCGEIQKRNSQTLSEEQFILECNEIHDCKYDYSQIVYKNSYSILQIVCPVHGVFTQVAEAHKTGHGCKQCGNKRQANAKRLTQEQFLEKAIKKHGDRYDYSKVNIIDAYSLIQILCKIHGPFEQKPVIHLQGSGCQKCRNDGYKEKYTISQENFINQCKTKHGDRYDYSQTVYEGISLEISIICTIHGVFIRRADSHLYHGRGCHRCAGEILDTNGFIIKAIEKHGDKYNYDKVIFVNSQTKVIITCHKHGDFNQKPSVHLMGNGSGCTKCQVFKNEEKIEQWFKEYDIEFIRQMKFSDCKYKRPLPFDFYVPDRNIAIEYQGEHHYQVVNRSKNLEKSSQKTSDAKRNDEIKKRYCESNNIFLLAIPYWEQKNISDILSDFFHSLQS